MTAENKAFVYTADMLDSDAANARSAAFRVIRDAAGLPEDDDGSLSETARKMHNACGTGARNAVNTVFKAMCGKKKREEWTPAQAEAIHGIMATEGIKAYRLGLTSAGYKTDDAVEAKALEAFKVRLVERRAQAEVAWKASQASGLDAAMKAIFG